MKKIVMIFNPSLEDGGVEKNLYLISNYFKNCGISVEILTANYDKYKNFQKGIKFIGTKNFFWQKKKQDNKIPCLFIHLIFQFNKQKR